MANGHKQATHLQPRDRWPSPAAYARPVLAALLVLVVLAGIRSGRPSVAGPGPWQRDLWPLAAGLEVVLAVLLVALWLIARRRPQPGYPAALLRAGLFRVILLGMAAVAVLAGLSRLNPHLSGRRPRIPVPSTPKQTRSRGLRGAGGHGAVNLTYVLYALVALLLLAAIVACVVMMLRRAPSGPAGDVTMLADDDDASMRDVIESGRRALRSFDDAQAAIIACYVAMEASLASAGTARDVAETPDELLARAVAAGVLRGTAAGRLTALFYEARYSSHALPPSARDEAARALDVTAAELERADFSESASSSSPEEAAP